MDSSLERIIKLIKKTGDRFVVTDSDFKLPYVVMSLEDYEKLALSEKEIELVQEEMSEGQLLEKINHDIAVWKSQQEKISETLNAFQSEEKKEDLEIEEKIETVEEKSSIKKEEEGGEDRYYFEPLES